MEERQQDPHLRPDQDPIRSRSSRILATQLGKGPTKDILDQVVSIWADGLQESASPRMRADRRTKSMKYDLEREKVKENRRFLAALGNLSEPVLEMEHQVSVMKAKCSEAQDDLAKADHACRSLITQAQILHKRQDRIRIQRNVTEAFLEQYTLTVEEVNLLTSPKEPVSTKVVDALIKSRKIHDDCQTLLVGESQVAGLSIMEQMTAYQKQCYDHLTPWLELELQSFSGQQDLDVRPLQRQVVDQIRRSPAHLEKIVAALIRIRRQALLRSFTDALVSGSQSGARPMELSAHEPARYVGDMLAWIHQALATEREFLDALIGSALTRRKTQGSMIVKDETTDSAQVQIDEKVIAARLAQASLAPGEAEEWSLQALVDQNISSACRPFKMRMQQIITTQQGNLGLHKIANIIRFYSGFIANTLGPHSLLGNLLHSLGEQAMTTFFKEVSAHGDGLVSSLEKEPVLPTLEPSSQILQISHLLREVVNDHRTWLPASASDDQSELEEIIQTIYGSAQRLLECGSSKLTGIVEQHIYLLNGLQILQGSLAGLGRDSPTEKSVTHEISAHKIELISLHFQDLFKEAGLSSLQEAMRSNEGSILSHCLGCESKDVVSAMSIFPQFLASVDPAISATLQKLLSSATASDIHRQALRKVADGYRWIVEKIMEPFNRYEFASTLIQVDPLEAATLLGVARL